MQSKLQIRVSLIHPSPELLYDLPFLLDSSQQHTTNKNIVQLFKKVTAKTRAILTKLNRPQEKQPTKLPKNDADKRAEANMPHNKRENRTQNSKPNNRQRLHFREEKKTADNNPTCTIQRGDIENTVQESLKSAF